MKLNFDGCTCATQPFKMFDWYDCVPKMFLMCQQVFDYAHWQTLSRCRPFCNIRHAEHWHLFVHKPNCVILSQNWNFAMFLWWPLCKIHEAQTCFNSYFTPKNMTNRDVGSLLLKSGKHGRNVDPTATATALLRANLTFYPGSLFFFLSNCQKV